MLVRVVVRDGNGRPVEGLKKEDFRLFDQGKEQAISQFEEESGAGGGPAAAPGTATAQAGVAGKPRFFALYFDNLSATADEMVQARDAADRYLAEHLAPNDRVAILTTEKVLSDFTGDRKQIHDALFQLQAGARVKPRVRQCPDLTDYQALEILETNDVHSDAWMTAWAETKTCQVSAVSSGNSDSAYPDQRAMVGIQMMARKIVDQARMQALSNFDGLRQILEYMARMPGERAVLLISPGFLSQDAQYQLDQVIDIALRSQVVIDSLDPLGLKFETRDSDASRPATVLANPDATQARNNLDAANKFVGSDVLAEVAQGTGGEFIHNENDLGAGLETLIGQKGRYVLAFVPKEMKRDGKFHELKVSLVEKKTGYTLEARRGYYVPKPGDEVKSAPEEAAVTNPLPPPNAETQKAVAPVTASPEESEIDQALKSQTDSDALPVGMEVKSAAGQLSVLTHLDVRPLPLRKDGEHSENQLTFVAAVFDQENKAVQVKERRAKVDLSDDQIGDFLKDGVEVQTVFQLKPGTYRLRVVVREADENKVASLSRQVTVP